MKEWKLEVQTVASPKKGGNERIVEVSQKSMSVQDMWVRMQMQILQAKQGEINYHGGKEVAEKLIKEGAMPAPAYMREGDKEILIQKQLKLDKALKENKTKMAKELEINAEIERRLNNEK